MPVKVIAGAAEMVPVSDSVVLYVPESCTATVNGYAPACPAVGTGPERRPPEVIVQPGGGVPPRVVDQVSVPLPPETVNCCE
jgi:hypothetical protein